jgi:hypothetical protein
MTTSSHGTGNAATGVAAVGTSIAVVGDTYGHRRYLRDLIARAYHHPASRIVFVQCPDYLAQSEIAAHNLHDSYDVVMTTCRLVDHLYDLLEGPQPKNQAVQLANELVAGVQR